MEVLGNQAHVWLLSPEDHDAPDLLAFYRSLLSSDEIRRADRYLREDSRVAFTIAHAVLRRLLSGYSDVAPQDWSFVAGEHGRPEIDTPAAHRGLRFNLSHTRGLIAFVFASGIDCGIDVEETERLADPAKLAKRVFAASEREDFEAQAPDLRRRRFHEYWTLKEAYIKATGFGLARPLREFAFRIGGDGAVAIRFDSSIDDDTAAWQFECRRPTPAHQLAVALRVGAPAAAHRIPIRVRDVVIPERS
jgi:4'-phosphopantetheinyl transferase